MLALQSSYRDIGLPILDVFWLRLALQTETLPSVPQPI